MRILVVYESLYGTNRMIARAIADGIGAKADVSILEAHEAPSAIGVNVDLVVVGGPNHKMGLPSPTTRAEAAKEGNGRARTETPGVREWLNGLQFSCRGQPVAVWDTRMGSPRILSFLDHSARMITTGVRRAGARLICKPKTFYSADGIGELVEGEEERARVWGTRLASLIEVR